jgi:hypothetical protein
MVNLRVHRGPSMVFGWGCRARSVSTVVPYQIRCHSNFHLSSTRPFPVIRCFEAISRAQSVRGPPCLPHNVRNYATVVKVPQMAESISEGTLRQFHKTIGDFVEQDEEIATIETDKVIPSDMPRTYRRLNVAMRGHTAWYHLICEHRSMSRSILHLRVSSRRSLQRKKTQ